MNEMLQFSLSHGGAVLFAVVFLEQIGVPIPAAPWLLAAGALSISGEANLLAVTVATLLACLSADLGWYYLGRRSGKQVVQFLCRLILSRNNSVEQIERIFARFGPPVVTVAKFVPGLSVAVPPLAGAFGIAAGRFVLFDLFGAVLYTALYLLLGMVFSNQVHVILGVLDRFGFGSLLLLLGSFVAYVLFKHTSRRQSTTPPTHVMKPQLQNT